jgi:hypothetical protein
VTPTAKDMRLHAGFDGLKDLNTLTRGREMTGLLKAWIDEVGPQVAALVRANPALLDEALKDPAGLARRELGIKLPFTATVFEKDGVYCVAPTGLTADNTSEELADEMLDFVSGGASGTLAGPMEMPFDNSTK